MVTAFAALVVATAWFAKVRDVGFTVNGATPLPVRVAVGLTPLPTFAVKVPGREPVATGLKVTLMVQVAPAAREFPQLLVWA